MTKKQLCLAQFLLSTYEEAQKYAEELDPKREHKDLLAQRLDAISRNAWQAFHQMTGKPPWDVKFWELNTENPAPWTRSRKQ